MSDKRICVIGGGPSGMMAAFAAASRGISVTLLEKNEKLGKKLYITGKGRCNVTNAADIEDFFLYVKRNPKFLYSTLYTFSNKDLMKFFEDRRTPLKTERGGRVFPASDKSSDVLKVLSQALAEAGVEIRLNTRAERIITEQNSIQGVIIHGKLEKYQSVIVATGGLSYPLTGSTGDGYLFAKETGHTVTSLFPSLIPFETEGKTAADLQGISLKNVTLSLFQNGKKLYEDMGEMLFTHFGISGPLVLSASAHVNFSKPLDLTAVIDFKPALTETVLDKRILRDFEKFINKDISNALGDLLLKRLIPHVLEKSKIDPDKKANAITTAERKQLLNVIKAFSLKITGLRPIEEAIITRGGISLKDIDSSTMQSKQVKGLYFAGEVLDTDALTGGYNMQIAFSTGYLAGMHA
jgi:predicted Rossmann fold flavoprotein